MKVIESIDQELKQINDLSHSHLAEPFVVLTESQNEFLISEYKDNADLAICLKSELVEKFANREFPKSFSMEDLSELSVLVEELSHFNTFCENAMSNRPVSSLGLEVQAEVDKFAFALECLFAINETAFVEQAYQAIFENYRLGEWVSKEDEELYLKANQIAKNYCSDLIEKSNSLAEFRKDFQKFFRRSDSEKSMRL